ncbi:MAG: MarR family winged helix-turn-helix transcriptional regulator [Sciscionella sp.]
MIPDIAPVDTGEIGQARLDAADRLGYQMVRFIRLISRIGAHLAAHQKDGIESAAYALLAHLVLDGPRRTTALAEAMHSDPSTVSRQSAALVRNGLVERRPDPEDGRACLLAATAHGERTFEHNRRQRDAHIATMLAGWPDADIHRLVDLLDSFNTSFESYRPQLMGADRSMPHDEGENVR